MIWIENNIGWILVASGILTCAALLQAVAPRFGMMSLFGEEVKAPSALLIIRSWGAMVFVSGLLLIYAAYHSDQRFPILFYSITVKLGLAGLVFSGGARYRAKQIFKIAVADFVQALLFVWYLIAACVQDAAAKLTV